MAYKKTTSVPKSKTSTDEKTEKPLEPKETKYVDNLVGEPIPAAEKPTFTPMSIPPAPPVHAYNNGNGNMIRPDMAVATEQVAGILDIQPEGHGFLRPKFIPSMRDIYISQSQIRRFLLRPGDMVSGLARPPKDTERYFGLLKVEKVNGISADESIKRPYFDDLTPMYPKKRIALTTKKSPLST
ncbi:MAG: hypothetical protein M1524_02845, partial [Patescibacteria group bacterium]|nr:hypothetical protein [Patescibacteria group bacterium]